MQTFWNIEPQPLPQGSEGLKRKSITTNSVSEVFFQLAAVKIKGSCQEKKIWQSHMEVNQISETVRGDSVKITFLLMTLETYII